MVVYVHVELLQKLSMGGGSRILKNRFGILRFDGNCKI